MVWLLVAAAFAIYFFWLWSGASPSSSSPDDRPLQRWATLEPLSPIIESQSLLSTAATAFASMEQVRDRMIAVGATQDEIDQLLALAPILLRVPDSDPDSESETASQ